MQTKTLFPLTALIALVAGAPLSWAQEAHDSGAGLSAGDDANAKATSAAPAPAQDTPSNTALAMAAGQHRTICNDRSNTIACSIKSIPHEPAPMRVGPAVQAPAPKQ